MVILYPIKENNPAIGIATKGIIFTLIEIIFPKPIKKLPVKSPNLVTNVSINTVDLNLSAFFS